MVFKMKFYKLSQELNTFRWKLRGALTKYKFYVAFGNIYIYRKKFEYKVFSKSVIVLSKSEGMVKTYIK